MIGPLLAINRDNIVREAIAAVTKKLTWDASVEVTARSHGNGIDALIVVAGTEGDVREIIVRQTRSPTASKQKTAELLPRI